MRLVLTNASLIDCVNLEPEPRSSVVVEDGRIVQISTGAVPVRLQRLSSRRPGRRLPASRTLGTSISTPNTSHIRSSPWPSRRPLRTRTVRGVDRSGGHQRPLWRGFPFYGCCLAGHLRRRTYTWSQGIRLRPLLDHHRRSLPDFGPCPGMRRSIRVRERHPRANKKRRRSH